MRARKPWLWAAVLIGIALLLAPAIAAADEGDPPARVARLSYSQGSVAFQPAGEQDWAAADPNRPLVPGDNLWADKDSRAELHVGSTAIRLGSETSITLLALDDNTLQIRLSMGSLNIRIRHLDDDKSIEVDTPNLAFALLRSGEYRVDVNADGNETVTTVWQGRGEVTGGGQSDPVLAGQQVRFTGTDTLDFDIQQLPPRDNFDDWALQRDDREDRAESANYVSREMTGYEDLDEYGHWTYTASYGPVWVPVNVPAGWAPYRFGHWVWVQPWGWTWVDDQPWGFAPFHYGRWVYAPIGWCWVPGPVVESPVYAPALVAFVGGGPGFNLSASIGGGGVAWFPLAPGEVYIPEYRASRVYVDNVNVTNTVVNVNKVTTVYNYYNGRNVTNVAPVTYVNQHVPNAVTVVSHDTFINARPVARNVVPVPLHEIERAPVVHIAAVTPVRASVVGAGAPTRVAPPAAVISRPVFAKNVPPTPQPAFVQRQAVGGANVPQAPTGGPRQVPRPPQAGQNAGQLPAGRTGAPPANAAAPLVRPAPPVQPKSSQQMANDESKYRNWQQQRQAGTASQPKMQPEQHQQQQQHGQPQHDQRHEDSSRSSGR